MNVLTVGGAMVDTVAIVDDALIERISMSNAGKSFLLLEQGAKTEVVAISTHCGGGGLNSAVSFSRLGHKVASLIKIGQDERSRTILSVMRQENIETRCVACTDAAPTGASTVISAHDRNAAVFTFRGANSMLTESDLDDAMFAVDLVYIAPLSGGSADLLPMLVERAASQSAKVVVNPGIRQITQKGASIFSMLPQIDVLVVNRLEAEALIEQAVMYLSARDDAEKRTLTAETMRAMASTRARHDGDASAMLASAIQRLGCKSALLTDGRAGAYYATTSALVSEPARKAEVVGTAGAGDAFASTFSAELFSGSTPQAALRAAAINAASVVSFADAQTGLLARANLEGYLRSAA